MVNLNVNLLDFINNIMNHRKLWIKTFGEIPKDVNGRSLEIHHIDGNHDNNDISNLKLVTIEEHFKIHESQGDYGACTLIAKRMKLPPDYISKIQLGKKRPGIGGVKKGTIPWNKGKKNCFNQKTIKKMRSSRKNKIASSKLNKELIIKIRDDYKNHKQIEGVGIIQKNGIVMTQERAYAKKYAKEYNITSNNLYNIITGKSWNI
jgi:hypothetical protein